MCGQEMAVKRIDTGGVCCEADTAGELFYLLETAASVPAIDCMATRRV